MKELISNKYEDSLRCIVRETSDTSLIDNCELKIEKVFGSLDNEEFVNEAMLGVDTVMHIYNIHHSPLIVQAAIENNVKKMVLVHTTGIYSKYKNASQEYKKIEEEIMNLISDVDYRSDITILRPTMIYGDMCDHNISKFIKLVDKLRVIPVFDKGNSLIQPVNARDLGKAYYSVLKSHMNEGLKIYDLSGDKPIKIIDVLKLISRKLNKKTAFVNMPIVMGVFLAKIIKAITLGKIDYIAKVQRMGENRNYSYQQATDDFGYCPMSIEEGIAEEVNEYLRKRFM